MQTSILGVVPWQEAAKTGAVVSLFVERVYGAGLGHGGDRADSGDRVRSIFSATLGYSRVPYAAALDGNFFSVFARVHPDQTFSAYFAAGAGGDGDCSAAFRSACGEVIRAILAMRCLIQFVGQALGLMLLHRRWGAEQWPFRMWLYPVPVVMAMAGWLAIFVSTGRTPVLASLAAAGVGILVYLGRARYLRQWPFEEVASMSR